MHKRVMRCCGSTAGTAWNIAHTQRIASHHDGDCKHCQACIYVIHGCVGGQSFRLTPSQRCTVEQPILAPAVHRQLSCQPAQQVAGHFLAHRQHQQPEKVANWPRYGQMPARLVNNHHQTCMAPSRCFTPVQPCCSQNAWPLSGQPASKGATTVLALSAHQQQR